MTSAIVERDERTTALENSGYRWSYLVLSFGLLLIVAYRSFARGEASWDLIGLVLVGGPDPRSHHPARTGPRGQYERVR